GEGDGLFAMLGSVPAGPRGQVLIALVLNSRADSPPSVHAANETVRRRVAAAASSVASVAGATPITAYGFERGLLVLVDRALAGHYLPEGQGVGLARK